MALLMRPDGTAACVYPEGDHIDPAQRKPFTLEELQEHIGGYVELVPLHPRIKCLRMLADEEGRLKNLPQNVAASIMAGQRLLGNVLLCCDYEFDDPPEAVT